MYGVEMTYNLLPTIFMVKLTSAQPCLTTLCMHEYYDAAFTIKRVNCATISMHDNS